MAVTMAQRNTASVIPLSFSASNVRPSTSSTVLPSLSGSLNSPDVESGNGAQQPPQFTRTRRVLNAIQVEGEPSWKQSYRYFLLGSWFNVLLVFVPLCFVSHNLGWNVGLRFSFSFLAIVPLAKLLGEATDQLSVKVGGTLSGLLNASFGNAVEIIVGITALLDGQLRIVQTSMLGSILSDILLVLGLSFLAGGLKYHECNFQAEGAQASTSLMTLACITLVVPAAYASFSANSQNAASQCNVSASIGGCPSPGLLTISRGTAVLLLAVYAAHLFFQLKTHKEFFLDEDEEEEPAKMNALSAIVGLMLVTAVTAFCAEYLVASIEEFAERYHIPETFIGLILLPLASNAPEHVTSIWMAMKNKFELTIAICIGSSIQIATFVIPLLVIVGWASGHELTLFFANFETVIIFVSVFLVTLLIMDGKSNYMEGLMLVTLYAVIALAVWVYQ
ncbi:calcium proton exchanger [Coniophora puteana RWD-64-598 SS2]|uniref:Vacuolar calcium ion transporter n=1 Tax=Coniophora puteana (strain RWD-64-598) TaxID=741705 RepID=A0A5M3N8F3_CONPW|nr:calcium proton exchanger [Coniophora puteana RWD-64-598 SS2]EIW87437.1 calcium proton exchanger [Coniophora puteana RWD-64-598 SS2]